MSASLYELGDVASLAGAITSKEMGQIGRRRLLALLCRADSVVGCRQSGDQRTNHGRAVRAVHTEGDISQNSAIKSALNSIRNDAAIHATVETCTNFGATQACRDTRWIRAPRPRMGIEGERLREATTMRTITLEEHFATPRFFDGPGRELKEQAEKFNNARALKLIPRLCDLGDKRIAEMDAAGIDMQIVSLTAPGVEQLEAAEAIALAAETNDFVADAIKSHPARFGGFAALPTAVPNKAAQEL